MGDGFKPSAPPSRERASEKLFSYIFFGMVVMVMDGEWVDYFSHYFRYPYFIISYYSGEKEEVACFRLFVLYILA